MTEQPAPDAPTRGRNSILLTTREAAKYLGVHEEKIRELARRKVHPLPHIEIRTSGTSKARVYFTKKLIDDFIYAHCVVEGYE